MNIALKGLSPKIRHFCLLALSIGLAQIVIAEPAFAATTSAFAPIQTAVQMVVDFIQGPFGRLCAIIAIMSLGIAAFAGRLSWYTAGSIVLGIGFVFGAPSLVDAFISAVGQ